MTAGARKFWRRGGGEVIGFLAAIPCLAIMLAAIVTVIRVGTFKQTLEHAAYKGCRVAVEAKNMQFAEMLSKMTAEEFVLDAFEDAEDVKTDLVYASDVESSARGSADANAYGTASGGNDRWKKGEFVTFTVSAKLRTFGGLFDGVKSASITMMIERPAMGDGATYEWFRGLS